MFLRRLEVRNYRGIKSLIWDIPPEKRVLCLVGPGDSGKSSILSAIHLALGDKWNPALTDTDFYDGDVQNPIFIRAVVSGLPKSLLKETAFGLWLTGLQQDGTLTRDPVDCSEPALIVQLEVDSTLEPRWTIERHSDPRDYAELRAHHRREFSVFMIDDRIDSHLRWNRTSALGRLSSKDNGAKNAIASANRAARDSITGLDDPDLRALSERVQSKINEMGGGSFRAIGPGLDTSLSTNGNLALYESTIPMTNFGVGTKRLAGIGIQQLAAGERSLLLIDEIEYGLEPHRAVALVRYLRTDSAYSQVFMTTHSSVIVEQASTESLAIVRNSEGHTRVRTLPSVGGTALRLRRQRPSSFLAKRILVVEGKTEEGLTLALIEAWDCEQIIAGRAVAAGEGVVVQDGQGGSEVAPRALVLKALGYEVGIFVDHDDASVDPSVSKAAAASVPVIRWLAGHNTESQVIEELDADLLTSFLELASTFRGSKESILDDLRRNYLPSTVTKLDVDEWLETAEVNIEGAREIISDAAAKCGWFKSVDGGRAIGGWLLANAARMGDGPVFGILRDLKAFLYRTASETLENGVEL